MDLCSEFIFFNKRTLEQRLAKRQRPMPRHPFSPAGATITTKKIKTFLPKNFSMKLLMRYLLLQGLADQL